MKITFQKATVHDIPVLNRLATEIWHEYYPSIISREQIKYMLEIMYSTQALTAQFNSGHQFTLVLVNDNPVGFISISEQNPKEYFLNKFYILAAYRGIKLGERLFKSVEDELPENKSCIRLFVNRINFKAINFYFKIGFKIESVVDKDIGNGFFMNDFLMIKKY